MSARRRSYLSIEQKEEIQQKYKDGILPAQIATDYGISISNAKKIRIKVRNIKREEFDKQLYKWYLEWNASGKISTYDLLYKQAEKIVESFEKSFITSRCFNGWLNRFIKNYRIVTLENQSSSSNKKAKEEYVNWLL